MANGEHSKRWACVALAMTLDIASTSWARAETVEACLRSAETGQELRARGDLLKAEKEFAACLDPTCPATVRAECAEWHQSIASRVPSIVVRVRSAYGSDHPSARVTVDGSPLELEQGHAILLNPGRHEVVGMVRGITVTERIVLREGERDRSVELVVPSVPAGRSATRWPGYLALGIGVGGAATAGTFGVLGLREWQGLSDCKPDCSAGDVDASRTKFLVSDVALAVAIVGIGVATYWLFGPPGRPGTPR